MALKCENMLFFTAFFRLIDDDLQFDSHLLHNYFKTTSAIKNILKGSAMNELTLFDLDNTLLNGDSDRAWGCYLVEKKLVDPKVYYEQNEKFYKDYLACQLDMDEYCEFAFKPFTQYSMEQLLQYRDEYIHEFILPMIEPQAKELVQYHKDQGHKCIIITATNSFITRPIADLFQIEDLIATDPEQNTSGFTGKLAGTPCFQEGKLTKLNQWLEDQKLTLASFDVIHGYSDSYNDLPLLQLATKPTAVNPDPKLAAYATSNNWPILNLHQQNN